MPCSGLPQVKNSAGEDVREGVYVSSAEDHELAGSKGTANFVIKWVRDARNQANLNVVEDMKKVVFKYTGEPFPPQPSSHVIHHVTCNQMSSKRFIHLIGIVLCNAADDEGKYAPLVAFECRGLDPIEWHPEVRVILSCAQMALVCCCRLDVKQTCDAATAWPLQGGFIVESTRGKIFRDADFSDKEWMDVDEDTGESVSVMELEWKFETRR